MCIAITDDRYFVKGIAAIPRESICYSLGDYRLAWTVLATQYPTLFSINLRDVRSNFITSIPPSVEIDFGDVVNAACWYYDDWETPFSVIDEFLGTAGIADLRRSMVICTYSSEIAERYVTEALALIHDALQNVISNVTSIFNKTNIPSVENYGSIYRFDSLDNNGNVFFRIRNPQDVSVEMEDTCF